MAKQTVDESMANAARGMSTADLTRASMDLIAKKLAGNDLNDGELKKQDAVSRELAQRPLGERVKCGANEIGRRVLGGESLECVFFPNSPDRPSTIKCTVCGGAGTLDMAWCSGACPACEGTGKLKVRKSDWSSLQPLEPVSGRGVSTEPVARNMGPEAEEAEGTVGAKSVKLAGSTAKSAKAAARPSTVEGVVQGGKAAYYKLQAKAGDEIAFTIYARQKEAGSGVECTFALQDEEGGNLDNTSMYVSATGEDFDRESLTAQVDEDGIYLFRFRSEGEAAVAFKVKIK